MEIQINLIFMKSISNYGVSWEDSLYYIPDHTKYSIVLSFVLMILISLSITQVFNFVFYRYFVINHRGSSISKYNRWTEQRIFGKCRYTYNICIWLQLGNNRFIMRFFKNNVEYFLGISVCVYYVLIFWRCTSTPFSFIYLFLDLFCLFFHYKHK